MPTTCALPASCVSFNSWRYKRIADGLDVQQLASVYPRAHREHLQYRESFKFTKSYHTSPNMYRLTLVVVILVTIGVCSAQLNFSTGWGKRVPGANAPSAADNCKSSVDTVMLLYKIIQAEAQKLVECDRFTK